MISYSLFQKMKYSTNLLSEKEPTAFYSGKNVTTIIHLKNTVTKKQIIVRNSNEVTIV